MMAAMSKDTRVTSVNVDSAVDLQLLEVGAQESETANNNSDDLLSGTNQKTVGA